MKFGLSVSLLLAITTITILPGHAVYDHVVLLPDIVLIALSWCSFAASSRAFRVVLALTALVRFWQWICAPLVIAVRPFVSHQFFCSVCTHPHTNCGFDSLRVTPGTDDLAKSELHNSREGRKSRAGELATLQCLRIFANASRFFAGRSCSATLASTK